MWFAFSSGINRYDGYTAKTFENFLPDSTLINEYKYVKCFLEDRDGNLWIGTLKNGLVRFNPITEQFTTFVPDPDDPQSIYRGTIGQLLQAKDGIIWIASFHKYLSYYDPVEEVFGRYCIDSLSENYSELDVFYYHEDRSGVLWLGTRSGLFQFDRDDKKLIEIKTDPEVPETFRTFYCIEEDYYGNLWFGTHWGIFQYKPETKEWKHFFTDNPEKLNGYEGNHVNDLQEYRDNNIHQLWIGTNIGLLIYDYRTEDLHHIKYNSEDVHSPISGIIEFIYLDDNNLLWLSHGGISLMDPRGHPFKHFLLYAYPDSLNEVVAQSFFEDSEGTMWVGSSADGLYKFDSTLNFISNHKATPWYDKNVNFASRNQVNLIYEDSHGTFWAGHGTNGLSVFSRPTETFSTVYLKTPSSTIDHVWVSEILEDSFGILWFGTQAGLFKISMPWKSGKDIMRVEDSIFPVCGINAVYEDNDSKLWIITINNGIYSLTAENRDSMVFIQYYHENYDTQLFVLNNVSSAYQDKSNNLWMRSETALYLYNEELDSIVRWKHFNKVFNGRQFVITGDEQDNLWFISDMGLMKYNPYDTVNGKLKFYDHYEGLTPGGIPYSQFGKSKSGYFYIGGPGNGFSRFHPDSVHGLNTNIPEIVITDFRVKNKPAKLDSSITYKKHVILDHDQNFFSFEFASMDYRAPVKNQFAYILEGLDEDWVHSGNRRNAYYTGVPPGDYLFRVKGSNNDGIWNEEGTGVVITIFPPPWRTWWAYTLYLLFIIFILIIIIRFYLKRQRLIHNLELEKLQTEKLEELDGLKSRFFANISHEFRTPLTLILGPMERLMGKTTNDEDVQDLNIMQRNARRLQKLINQLLNLSKLESGNMKLETRKMNIVQLVKGYTNSFESLAKQKNIELSFTSEQDEISVWIDQDKIEKILYNLISNAFKFTGDGGRISVNVNAPPLPPQRRKGSKHIVSSDSNSTDSSFIFTPGMDAPTPSPPWGGSRRGIIVSVSDTGRGIPPERLPNIFDRFYQAGDSYSVDQEGTGIGLALTKELVELHHGTISVESTEGIGTTFTVLLPLGNEHLKDEEIVLSPQSLVGKEEIVNDEVDALIQEPISIGNLKSSIVNNPEPEIRNVEQEAKPLLLIVEDNNDLRSYIRSYLEADYNISEAIDGEIGLRKAIEKIPDLILSDVMMPMMDGYQLCKEIKTDERTSHIPVILLTAKAAMEDKLEGLETGADDFLTKPFDPAELMVRIRNLIEQRAKLRERYLVDFNLNPQPIPGKAESMDEQFMQKAISLVNEHLSDPDFSVEKLGEEMAMSRMQLHRKFKAVIDLSATGFIRVLRLKKAAELLQGKTGNVTQIAYDVGFNNLSYFAKCFQEYFGITPSEYVKRHTS